MGRPVFRFAPSPNGELHLGHALSALIGFEMARRLGGRFLLRIEDIDLARTRSEYVDAIFEDLAWLGLEWEEPVLRQSEHFADYQAAADRLQSLGLLYPCPMTRADLAALATAQPGVVDPDGAPRVSRRSASHLQEEWARIERGEPYALRLRYGTGSLLWRGKWLAMRLTFTEFAMVALSAKSDPARALGRCGNRA